ncbi:MAG: HupE/UreJ family protein [Maribacter sp.]
MKKFFFSISFILFFLTPLVVSSHQPDQSFIYFRVYETQGIEGRFDVHINELNSYFGLNLGVYPKEEQIRPALSRIHEYLLSNTKISSVYGEYNIKMTDKIVFLPVVKGAFVQFFFKLENSEKLPEELEINYTAFFDKDPKHVMYVAFEYNWKAGLINNEALLALNFTKNTTTQKLSLTDSSIWKGFVAMIKQGVWHIWIGLDHILFLLALILPSVVRRKKSINVVEDTGEKSKFDIWGWEPVQKFRPAFMYILKVVTFFTIAHTITLSLASLNIVTLPSRAVESIIALSIGLAAYHNIKPIFKGKDWLIAFVFGLFHGFGFASVMADLGITGEFLTLTLLGFNIGVEIGQVIIIAMIFPILYFIRKLKLYPKFLVYLSVALIVISLYWFVERAFDIDLVLDEKIMRLGGDILRALGLREDYYN